MAIDISGVTLPNVPANVLVRYPSAVILKMTSGDTTVYALLAATNFFGHATKNIISSMEYEEMLGSLGAGRAYYAQADASVWDVGSGEVAAGELMLPVGTVDNATVTLVWANHDVLEITSLDTSTGDYTTGGVYFAQTADTSTGTGNNDASIYRIRRSRLAGIGDQVRRLTEVSPDLTPEEIEAMLAELDITLEEAYVTPSTEQQEIYPSAYGFSKVIVEAVEDSGGGDSGDSGGGGGTYKDAESTDFGYEIIDGKLCTGRYKYGSEEGGYVVAYPFPPVYNHQYMFTFNNKSGIGVIQTSSALQMGASVNISLGPTADRCHFVQHIYQGDETGEWKEEMSGQWIAGEDGAFNGYIPQWSNYNVYYYTGELALEATAPIPETFDELPETAVNPDETYTINGATANDLVLAAQKITGTKEPMTPDEAITVLNEFYENPNNNGAFEEWKGGSY